MNINNFSIIILLFLITCLVSSSVSQSDNIIDSESKAKIDELVKIITNLNNSSHVVLSIDCSGSMNDTQKRAKITALKFLSELKNNTKGNIKVGYVSWNYIPLARSRSLSSNFDNIYQDINDKVRFGGVTCIKSGLNESLELLRNEAITGNHNILVIISDGLDNCTVESNLTCGDIREIDSKGINIYTIQIGNSRTGSALLKCLEKRLSISKPISFAPLDIEGKMQETKVVDSSSAEMKFLIEGNKIEKTDQNTNMTISKEITGGTLGPRITLDIKAPGVEAIRTNVVIAVDSSGSLGKGGRAEYGENIRKSIPVVLKNIEQKMPLSNVSVISWDDNVDFAYSSLNNTKAADAKLVPISEARREISDNEVFISKSYFDRYPYPINRLAEFFRSLPDDYYYCKETEITDLNVGLDSARIVLNRSTQNPLGGIRKLIILVTARSEFIPCNESLIIAAKNDDCDIHTIGVGVIDGSELHMELKRLAGDRAKPKGDEDKYHYSPGSVFYNNYVIASVIEKALKQFYTENISNNLIIEDTLYPYLQIDNNTLFQATLNGNLLGKDQVSMVSQTNPDNTTTLKILFNKSLNMKPNDDIKVIFDTYLNISMPIDATISKTSRVYSIDRNTPMSSISYRWLGNNHVYVMPLPECSLNIR